jgi:hypothetical protein
MQPDGADVSTRQRLSTQLQSIQRTAFSNKKCEVDLSILVPFFKEQVNSTIMNSVGLRVPVSYNRNNQEDQHVLKRNWTD